MRKQKPEQKPDPQTIDEVWRAMADELAEHNYKMNGLLLRLMMLTRDKESKKAE